MPKRLPPQAFVAAVLLFAGVSLTALLTTPQAASPAAAGGDLARALQLQSDGDSAAARRLLSELAEGGDALAQYNLGALLAADDPALAARWYARAARGGEARAAHNLGHLYLAGDGLPRDLAAAREAFARGAELGLAAARYNLGVLRESGIGGDPDPAAAQADYRVAAAAGHAPAALQLARSLAVQSGGVAQLRALHWLAAAGDVARGRADAALRQRLRRGEWRSVDRRVVNLRAAPNTNSAIVEKLQRDERLLLLESRGDWLRIGRVGDPPTRGWVYAPLLRRADGP